MGALLATGALALLLAACASVGNPDTGRNTEPINNVVAEQPLEPAFVGMVRLKHGQTLAEAAAAYGGQPVHDGTIGAQSIPSASGKEVIGFLAFDEIPVTSQSADDSGFEITFEPNIDRFRTSASLETLGDSTVWAESFGPSLQAEGDSTVWAEGDSTVWAEGDSTVWAEGDSTVWAEGDSTVWAEGDSTVWAEGRFLWMPPNTNNWEQISLRSGHREARKLGHRVIVAVIDTGIDVDHQAFAGALSRDGRDFVDNDWDPSEEGSSDDQAYGHGTIVAGIVRQIAPRATILPIRALSADGSGNVLDVVRAIYYAVDNGAQVINLSMGGPEESPALREAIEYANSKRVFVTISAGNNGRDFLNFPAVMAAETQMRYVTSVISVDSNRTKSVFSNYGSGARIAAPGELIYGPYPELRVAAWSGTSMAAPTVAGALALALSSKLDGDYRGSGQYELLEEMREEGNSLSNGSFGARLLDVGDFLDEVID